MGARSGSRERDRDRDRDRKAKKKKRSASSESAERSREREKRRRKQQQQHVNKTRAPGVTGAAAGMEGAGQRMFWDGFQWVPRADTSSVNPNDPNVSRKMRRLYLGNLPYHLGVTEDSFSKQLYDTMKERGLCNDPNQNPVLHVWFARDKGANYGFCEVASIEETERALQLDGMVVLGVPVSIKRPNDAVSPMGMVAGMQPGMAAPGGMLALPAMQVQATTNIIHIEQILKVDSKTTKEDYDDVVEDMNEGCGAHGKLTNVFIVRPQHEKDGLKAGDVYLQCVSMDDATKIMRAMGHRKYDGRQIQMKSFEEDKYNTVVKPLAS